MYYIPVSFYTRAFKIRTYSFSLYKLENTKNMPIHTYHMVRKTIGNWPIVIFICYLHFLGGFVLFLVLIYDLVGELWQLTKKSEQNWDLWIRLNSHSNIRKFFRLFILLADSKWKKDTSKIFFGAFSYFLRR